MLTSKQKLGKWGEKKAISYLKEKGYQIRVRNFRTRHGEIDIIASYGNKIYFIEVKTRRSSEYGFPEEAVIPTKVSRIKKTAYAYLNENNWQGDFQLMVLAILGDQEAGVQEYKTFLL